MFNSPGLFIRSDISMKNFSFLSVLFTIFIFLAQTSPVIAVEKKKLFLSRLNSSSEVEENLKISIQTYLKKFLLESQGLEYNILSEEEISVIYKKIADAQKAGCNTEACYYQIGSAIDADDLIYGNLFGKETLTLTLNLIKRDRKTSKVSVEGVVIQSFSAKNMEYMLSEMVKKLMNLNYTIQKKSSTDIVIKYNNPQFLEVNLSDSIKSSEVQNEKLGSYFEEKIKNIDSLFINKKYTEALLEYEKLSAKMEEELGESSQKNLGSLKKMLINRILVTKKMLIKEKVLKIDLEVEKILGNKN